MVIAITGGSGFIGSYTIRALAAAGHEVRALVRPTSRREHIAGFVKQWVEGDAADRQVLAGLVRGVDAVIHDAVDWDALERSPATNFDRNVHASLDLLEAARQAEVGQFLFVSSVAVYHDIPESAGGRITEETPALPRSIYGAYKAAMEAHLKAYHATYGMNTSAWRPAAVYGIDPKIERSQWYDIVVATKRGGMVDVSQGGKITHVQDIADVLTLAVGDESTAGQLYNLVDGYMYWQVAGEIAKELSGSDAEIRERKGKGPKHQFDTAKAIAFFDRHSNRTALRRGVDGVREYVKELLPRV